MKRTNDCMGIEPRSTWPDRHEQTAEAERPHGNGGLPGLSQGPSDERAETAEAEDGIP